MGEPLLVERVYLRVCSDTQDMKCLERGDRQVLRVGRIP